MSTPRRIGPVAALAAIAACGTGSPDLSPAAWPDGETERYHALDQREFPDNPLATGREGAVTTTYHATAARAGLEALRQGGSSVDAALTAALTQVALGAGAVISYFGIMTMVHFDAATGEIVTMNAGWNTVRGETDPMSIPGSIAMTSEKALLGAGQPSGRTVLVGGFMRGVEAAHARYGKLPFAALFTPAIQLAEDGFTLTPATASFFEMREPDLHRLPETAATLLKPDGSGYRAGDVFKQPAVAATLRNVVAQGADYMYKGDWAAKLVRAVQSDGGHLAMEDLAAYEVFWSAPRRAALGDYQLALLGPPNLGSVSLIEALNLAMAAGIPELGHWSKSAESLRRLSDVTTMFYLSFIPSSVREQLYPGLDLSDDSRTRPETAAALWERMEQGVRPFAYAERAPSHSDVVVAVDRAGNMTAITHSINSVIWGKTALIVDGVSTGDPGAFQQAAIAATGPGKRLPDPTEVGIALKDGRPVLAFASMATGLHQQTVQSLLNTLVFGMSVKEAVDAPALFLPLPDGSTPPRQSIRVMKGAFPEEVLRGTGLPFVEIPASERRFAQGLWVGIWRDPATGELAAASPPYASGRALAY